MYVRNQSGLSGWGLGDTTSPLVSSLAASIRQVEGYNPNFAPNNNPGNLIYVKGGYNYPGCVPGAGGFCAYPDTATGEAALEHQISVQIASGQNLTDFFNQYAPGNTKNAAGGVQTPAATQAYINTVSSQLGIDPSIPLNSVQGSYSGPGSFDTLPSPPPDSSTSSFDLSSLFPSLPSSDSQYSVGGLVLSGSDLLLLGAVVAGVLVVSAII